MPITVKIPTLHEDQVKAFLRPGRFKAIRCGRRWGKSILGEVIAGDAAIRGEFVGIFAPDYKRLSEIYNDLASTLLPVKLRSSKTEGVIRTITGGRIDFWTLDDPNAGRSRKYHRVIIDEAAFTNNAMMMDTWKKAIRPTLVDYRGSALALSNTNGDDPTNFFWRICNEPEHGFVEYHAPTHNNPMLPLDEIESLQASNHPLVYAQEYLAEFVSWAGVAFFSLDKLLVEGKPIVYPSSCDAVFAVVDTATKTGKDNDSTGVVYISINKANAYNPVIILDWDVLQIEGASLEIWLPTVISNLEVLAKKVGARMGSIGAMIEDKDSGQILLQQARRKSLAATAIPSTLTALGKDERALSVSGFVHQGKVLFSDVAYEKVSTLKNATRNHLVSQVTSFRVGDKDAAKRADDLLDCFTYAIALALGDADGL